MALAEATSGILVEPLTMHTKTLFLYSRRTINLIVTCSFKAQLPQLIELISVKLFS